MKKENIFLSAVVIALSVILIWFALKTALFIGWIIGGGIGIIVAVLFLFSLIDLGWLFTIIAFVILVNFLLNLF